MNSRGNDAENALIQRHKGHNVLREKIKKKRKREKEIKKEKKEKKKVKEREKEDNKSTKHDKYKKKSKEDHHMTENKLYKVVKKFLGVFEDDIHEFFGIFQSLDQGQKIDIAEMEDPKVSKYLKKIFKYLKCDVKPGTLEYTKNYEISKGVKLGDRIQTIVEAIQRGEGPPPPPVVEEKPKNKYGNMKVLNMEPEPRKLVKGEEDQAAEVKPLVDEPPAVPKVYGPALVPKLMPDSTGQMVYAGGEVKKSKGDEFMDNLFSVVAKDKKKAEDEEADDGLDEHANLKRHFDKNKYKTAGAKKKEEYTAEEQEEIKTFLQGYNEANRSKSLMEIHRETKRAKKGLPAERRGFDRDKDLAAGRVDSKHLFRVINDSDMSLGSRFNNPKFEKTF